MISLEFSHHTQFPVNHPLGMLGNFMGVQSLQNLQNLQNLPNMQHGDVLEKLKLQVREMKVGLMVNYPNQNFVDVEFKKKINFLL